MSRASPATPGSSSPRCRSRRSSGSRASRRRSASSRRRPATARGHGRHGHRDLRLPADPLRAAGPAVLPEVRHPDRHADGRRDRREGAPPARGFEDLHDGAGGTPRRRDVRGALGRSAGLGVRRVRVDGQSVDLDKPPKLTHRRKHRIEVVVDRAVVRRSTRSRLADSIESALDLGKGVVHIARVGDEGQRAELAG